METKSLIVRDKAGNVDPNAEVTVTLFGTTTLAEVFDADDLPTTNPVPADGNGNVEFKAANGFYTLTVTTSSSVPPSTPLLRAKFFDFNDVEVSAIALDVTDDPTATYTPEENTIVFGIPRGSDEAADISTSGGSDVQADLDDLETLTRPYETREAFVAADPDVESGTVAFAEGLGYRKNSTFSLPGLNNWRPLNNVLDIRQCGSTSALSSDFAGIFEQACEDAGAEKWKLNVSAKEDGSPYEPVFIDHTLTSDLRINFEETALWMPQTNFEHFTVTAGNLSGPFVTSTDIREWGYEPSNQTGLVYGFVRADGTTEGNITPGNITVDDNGGAGPYSFVLATPLNAGDTFIIAGRKQALRFKSTLGAGRRVTASGYLKVDITRQGYVLAQSTGGGLSSNNVDFFQFKGTLDVRGVGYGSPSLSKRGDSGFVPLGYYYCEIGTILGYGLNDLPLYAGGGADFEGEDRHDDDGLGLVVGHIRAERCQNAGKIVRENEMAKIRSVHCIECLNGWLHGLTGSVPTGGGLHIESLQAIRMGRRVIDWGDANPVTGAYFGNVSCRDIGYDPNGVAEDGAAAVFMSSSAGLVIGNLDLGFRDWEPPAGVPAVRVAGEGNWGNRINGGTVRNFDVGIDTTGGSTNDVGDYFKLTMKDVAQPLDLGGTGRTDYDLQIITDTAGTLSVERIQSIYTPIQEATATFLLNAPAGTPTYNYIGDQEISYRQILNQMFFQLRLNVQVTHSESGRQIRLPLPFTVNSPIGETQPVTMGRPSGFTLPSTGAGTDAVEFYAEAPDGQDFLRLGYVTAAGTNVIMTSDQIASGSTLRIEISGWVPVAE